MQGIKTQNAEDENEEEEGARRWWFCSQHDGLLGQKMNHFLEGEREL